MAWLGVADAAVGTVGSAAPLAPRTGGRSFILRLPYGPYLAAG